MRFLTVALAAPVVVFVAACDLRPVQIEPTPVIVHDARQTGPNPTIAPTPTTTIVITTQQTGPTK